MNPRRETRATVAGAGERAPDGRSPVPLPLILRALGARDVTCARCRSERVHRSGLPYGRIVRALGLVALRCEDCGRRFPAPRRLGSTHVVLRSEVAGDHPMKQPVEADLLAALETRPGRWLVTVVPGAESGRWQVALRGRGRVVRLTISPGEQESLDVMEAVRAGLRSEGLAR
jgi:hypothetical protein